MDGATHGGNRCTAHLTDGSGRRCKKNAILGGNVCGTHGGSAPQVRAKAHLRLLAASDRVAGALVAIAMDKKQPAAARVQACRDILDRAGLKRTEVVEHRQVEMTSPEEVARVRDELADRRAKKAVGE